MFGGTNTLKQVSPLHSVHDSAKRANGSIPTSDEIFRVGSVITPENRLDQGSGFGDTFGNTVTKKQASLHADAIPTVNHAAFGFKKRASGTMSQVTNEQELQAELKNLEEFGRANNLFTELSDAKINNERVTGYPNPKLYDQYYINKYSFPKGLCTIYKGDDERQEKAAYKKSLYDIKVPNPRRGISGWKLTRRPQDYMLEQGPESR